jgi:hypothetical protein
MRDSQHGRARALSAVLLVVFGIWLWSVYATSGPELPEHSDHIHRVQLQAWAQGHGALYFDAFADALDPLHGGVFWLHATVTRDGQIVWDQELSNMERLPVDKYRPQEMLDFGTDRVPIELAPGIYDIRLELREDIAEFDEAGKLKTPYHRATLSKQVEVN